MAGPGCMPHLGRRSRIHCEAETGRQARWGLASKDQGLRQPDHVGTTVTLMSSCTCIQFTFAPPWNLQFPIFKWWNL
jgi:hypothetical protein